MTDGYTPGGQYWTEYFLDLVLTSADGTVKPIFNEQQGVSLNVSATSGVSNPYSAEIHVSGQGQYPDLTQYYHSDHLGSARLLTSYAGYPTYSATFLPFGEEWNPQATVNHYKFDGKERDSESGLDDFGARYYASTYGRFMSADWSAIPEPVPYANLSNPQTLNLYAIVHDNPETFADLDGHQGAADGQQPDCAQSDVPSACQPSPNNKQGLVTADQMRQSSAWERTKAGDAMPMVLPNLPTTSEALAKIGNLITSGLSTAGDFLADTVDAAADVAGGTAVAAGVLIYSPATGTGDTLSPAQMAAQQSEGCVYCVSGDKTQSGKDYIGRTDNLDQRTKDNSDGRDRSGAQVVDTYPKGNRAAGRTAEQNAINGRGGVGIEKGLIPMNERPIPEAALRDKDAVEMLRVWIAERQLQCSMKVGMYQETMNIPEGRAWGVILADVTRHVAMAMESAYSANRSEIVQQIRDSFLKELANPSSEATGEFVQ